MRTTTENLRKNIKNNYENWNKNLRTKTDKVRVGGFHIDYEDCTTSIFYFNDNDGQTSFESGGYVKSVSNRLITFPSNIRHSGSTCTNTKARFVLNLNYIPAN